MKRLDANLLAGRVINRSFFPLTYSELKQDISPPEVLRLGLLPDVRNEPRAAMDILEAYAANYLREEVQQEALTKDLAAFSRFLRVAGLLNGQVVNVTKHACESAVARPTVQRYFEVSVDTLIGVRLRAWQPRLKVREVAHPKFYFFDCGVARAAAGRVRAPLHDSERGPLLETWVLHELRAHLAYTNAGGDLSYYRTPSGVEVDFIWSGPRHSVGIGVKSSRSWRKAYGAPLRELHARKVIRRAVGVYEGEYAQKDGPVEVLPVLEFFERLPMLIR